MDGDSVNNSTSVSTEDTDGGEVERESNNLDSLEVLSSSRGVVRELESAGEMLTRLELDLACCSEKLVNLNILVMHVATREGDYEAFVAEKEEEKGSGDYSAGRALEFDLLYGVLDSEVRELDSFLKIIQTEIADTRGSISACKDLDEAFKEMVEKLHDCEESLKQSFEQVREIKLQSSNFQRILSTPEGDETWKDDKGGEYNGDGGLSNLNAKLKMQTAEQQRHILRMLEKSLARELDLEKKLTDSRQVEDDLKFRLQQEVFCMEDEVEGTWERLFEAENAAEVLFGISKELKGKLQIVQFNLNGAVQREGDLRSKLLDIQKKFEAKDTAMQMSERTCVELRDQVHLLERQLKERDIQLQLPREENHNHMLKIQEMENIINQLMENISEAESRAQTAETECTRLKDTNSELNKDLTLLKIDNSNTSERVDLLEKQLRESDIKLQHAVASEEASQEKQKMLYSTIKDMENLIEDLKSKVSKAERQTESVEEKCIILSESNSDLIEELNFLRGRMQRLEASLSQAEEAKQATAKDIGIRTRLITELIMKLALERQRLHDQVSSLIKEKTALVRHLQHEQSHPFSVGDKDEGNIKGPITKESDENSATSHVSAGPYDSVVTEKTKTESADSNEKTKIESGHSNKHVATRDIDPRQLNLKYSLVVVVVLLISALATRLFQY